MRVFRRGLILGALLSALATVTANAAPILLPSGDSPPACDALGVANSECRLFSLGPLTGDATFDFNLVFASDRDVAVFEFSIDADATFAAETSSTGLFPQLGLFSDDAMKTIYADPVNGQQALSLEPLEGFLLDGAGGGTTYYLAVLLLPNNGFGGLPTSLLAPFACDGLNGDGLGEFGEPLCPGAGGSFSLRFSATSTDGEPQPVPEPATFTLVAGGALAALVRRRSTKRNQRKDVTKS